MSYHGESFNDEGVEVDFYDGDDGSITIIHDTEQSREDILAASSAHSREALHNLDLSAIRRPAKEVTFSNIKVRTYPICLGDNPACSDGVPLAIDWQYLKEYNFTVDYYERKLEKWANSPDSPMHPNRYPRKTEEDLRISAADRMQLLYSAGFRPTEATITFRQVEAIRRNRQSSIRTLHFWQLLYAWERIQRATRNATVGRASKQKERLMLQPYRDQLLDDSIEISVDQVTTPRRWFTFRRNNKPETVGNLHHKKRKKPSPVVIVDQSYETHSVKTNTPLSVVSYNGDTLFPPTPTSSPLSKTIRERKMTEFEPRVIDMTGQVSSRSYGINSSRSAIVRSPTMKRTNKPKDRFFDDDSSVDLIGEGIMDRSIMMMDQNNSSLDQSMSVDRYAPAAAATHPQHHEQQQHQQPQQQTMIPPQMDEFSSSGSRLNTSANSVASGSVLHSRQLEWISSTGSTGSGSNHSRQQQQQQQQPMSSGSNHSRHQQQQPMPSGSNHSYHSSSRGRNNNDAASVASGFSNPPGAGGGSQIGNNIRQLANFTMRMSNVENADRGYFLDADERYY